MCVQDGFEGSHGIDADKPQPTSQVIQSIHLTHSVFTFHSPGLNQQIPSKLRASTPSKQQGCKMPPLAYYPAIYQLNHTSPTNQPPSPQDEICQILQTRHNALHLQTKEKIKPADYNIIGAPIKHDKCISESAAILAYVKSMFK